MTEHSTINQWGLPDWVFPIAQEWVDGLEGEDPAALEIMRAWVAMQDWDKLKKKLARALDDRFISDALAATDVSFRQFVVRSN